MGGVLVGDRGLPVAIDLHENKSLGIVGLLDNVKASDARFEHAVARVFDGRFFEAIHKLRLHMNVDMDDVHGLFQDAPFGRIRREISGGDSPRRYLPRGIPSGAGLDACVAACLFPLALFILLNGLDDVVLDLALAWDWIARRRSRAADDTPEAPPSPEKRIAIFVPLWREHEVIQGMV